MSRKRPTPEHTWAGVKITSRASDVFNPDKHLKKNIRLHGFVTKNHSTVIVKERKRRNGAVVYDYVGDTKQLSKDKQAAIANALDHSKGLHRTFIYDEEKKK